MALNPLAPLTSVAARGAKVNQQLATACKKYSRAQEEVRVLAVSKTQPLAAVEAAIAAGFYHFGENYLQDALPKIQGLTHPAIFWHFIGAIQSNKTKEIAENFSYVHTLSRLKIAQRLNKQRPANLPPLKVFIQVNISNEANKAGVQPAEVFALAKEITQLPQLSLQGLMCLPEAAEDFNQQRQAFAQLAQLQTEINQQLRLSLSELSMGMTQDLEAAIAEGSTWVRIGTGIFGARQINN